MKLKKETNNPLFYICLLFSFFCCTGLVHFNSFPTKKLYGVWQYRAIYKNGISALTPDEADTMVLDRRQSRFHYKINSLRKDLGGTFKVKTVPADSSPYEKALEFHYQNKSIRTFNIMLLSDSLIIREGNTTFHYRRKKP